MLGKKIIGYTNYLVQMMIYRLQILL